ncbi:hypothetical protein [Methanoregula sp.]|jgi:hypothetical protein|uniref:hypothetical protein n=1 Tax=Methanoregula sp. TaxID=2052170 RepID=UPI0025F94D01|nr:hypothetical protein [Methanoregula sp.]
MPELFVAMVKEEWRVHSTMFGSLSFALFPILIFWIAFMGSFLLPLMRQALPAGELSLILHANYLMLGFMVGAFGLLGSEVMNRRFGQASLLSYSARSLPLSERFIFANFVVKDTLYYFVLWVLPLALGFLLASPFIGVPVTLPLLLALTLTLSFMSGLCAVFFLSSVYSRSKPALAAILAILAVAAGALYLVTGQNPAVYYPPLNLFLAFSWTGLLISLAAIVCLFVVSIWLFSPETVGVAKHHKSMLVPLTGKLSVFPYPPLAAKDLIDMYRSGGMVGQTLFSFLIPLVVIWFFLSLLSGYLPAYGVLIEFALVTGVIASTMYTWITMFDTFGAYACLPVSVRTLIKSKITTFSVLQIIPALFIAAVSILSGQALYLVPAVVLCLSLSFYSLGITVWLTGLSPSVLVYDVKVMVTYLALTGAALLVLSAVAFAVPFAALGAVLLLIPAVFFARLGFAKWEAREQPGF